MTKGKYIVFDVDETLGYFSQLGSFIDAISFYNKDFSGSVFERFNEILDLFPEFVRPKMIETLKYIHEKKGSGTCSGVFIYTNNQGPRSWVQHIAKYFDYKVGNVERNDRNDNASLFDKIIAAYMINGKIVEPGRTSQNKTYADLLRITGISPQSEVCFVDDLNHHEMRHENVLYLNVKPYVKTLSIGEMIRRYLKSPLASNIVNTREFTAAISERMGSIKHLNQDRNRRLNLHDSNYISLNNTPFDSVASREEAEYKASGETLFHYIQYFLKTNKTKMQSRRVMRRGDSQTRRHRGPRRHSKDKIYTSVSTSTHQTRKHTTKGNKLLHIKTRRNGKFMRI